MYVEKFFNMIRESEDESTSKTDCNCCSSEFKMSGKKFIYKISGWHEKDPQLLNRMIRYNKHAVCYSCFNRCNYDSFEFVKTISYHKMKAKIDKILIYLNPDSTKEEMDHYACELNKIPNILCICNNCYENIEFKNIPKAPNNINHIIEKYKPNLGDIGKLHMDMIGIHKLIIKRIKKIKNNNNHLTRCMNYLGDENKKMESCVKIEEVKYNELIKTYNRNTKLMNRYKKKIKEELSELNMEIEKNISQTYDTCKEYSKEKTNDESTLICKICSNNRVNIVLIGCGHVYCRDCLEIMINNFDVDYKNYMDYIESNDLDPNGQYDYKPELKCPECRCDIKKYTNIFL